MSDNSQSSDGINPETTAALYAGVTGIILGTSVNGAVSYSITSILGGIFVACGIGYEIYQRSLEQNADRSEGSSRAGKSR